MRSSTKTPWTNQELVSQTPLNTPNSFIYLFSIIEDYKEYIQTFTWDSRKFNTKLPLVEICQGINKVRISLFVYISDTLLKINMLFDQ